jgi:hypothetical protein
MVFETRLGIVVVVPASFYRKESEVATCMAETAAYAEVSCPQGASSLGFKVSVVPGDSHATIFVVHSGEEPQVINPYQAQTAIVPITWKGNIPQTRDREQNRDCLDIIIMEPDGWFVDVEVGIITRRGRFYMTAQRIWEGQVVRTRENGKLVSTFVPGRALHAYPGAKFEDVWDQLADAVLAKAKETGASDIKSNAFIPTWNPPALPETNGGGWKAGIVQYFNLVSGTGELVDANGVKYFVHFKNVLPPEGSSETHLTVPTLTPMSVVLFRPNPENGHERQPLKSVQSVRPFLVKEPVD